MKWDYRIVRSTTRYGNCEPTIFYTVMEATYDEDGDIISLADVPPLSSINIIELKNEIEIMREAFDKGVIDGDAWKEQQEKNGGII